MGLFRRRSRAQIRGRRRGPDAAESSRAPLLGEAELDELFEAVSAPAFVEAADQHRTALAAAADEYAARLAGQTPEQAATQVRAETGDAQLADKVAERLWLKALPALDEPDLRALVGTVWTQAESSSQWVDRVLALDDECERRGLEAPPPLLDLSRAEIEAKPEWDEQTLRFMAANWLHWELNHQIASGERLDEWTIVEMYRADAEAQRARRRMRAAEPG